MPVKAKQLPSVSLIGSGNLAQSLGPALHSAGYEIRSIAIRNNSQSRQRARALAKRIGARTISLGEFAPDAETIWLCHADDALANTARLLARKPGWKDKIAFHSSGALSSDVLEPLKHSGAHVASVHPLMTFVLGVAAGFRNVPIAVEGDAKAVVAARRVVSQLGAEFFAIPKRSKVLYHALGSFSSPMLAATLATAERVGIAAGLSRKQTRKMIAPIIEQTIRNYLDRGAAEAFSGPIKRGDLETVRRHLSELRRVPEALEVYRALVKSALRELPARNSKAISRLLK